MKAKTKNLPAKLSPDFLDKERSALARKRRQAFYLNEKEAAAIDEYCRRFKVSSRSALYRRSIMEHIMEGLDESHPTLF